MATVLESGGEGGGKGLGGITARQGFTSRRKCGAIYLPPSHWRWGQGSRGFGTGPGDLEGRSLQDPASAFGPRAL